MYCHSCGTQLSPDVQFCPVCGRSLGGSPPPVAPPVYAPGGAAIAPMITPGAWIGAGWRIVEADLGNFILLALVYILLNAMVPFILKGPLAAGFHIYCLKGMLGRRPEFQDLFKGFNFFVPALVASLLIVLFTSLGALLCIIPGLVVAAMYMFTYLFIVDKRMDFWQAMQASHNLVRNDYFAFTMFFLLIILINLLGVLCCVVGVLVSLPVSVAATTVAYQQLVGFDPRTPDSV